MFSPLTATLVSCLAVILISAWQLPVPARPCFCDATKQFTNPASVLRVVQRRDTCPAVDSLTRVLVAGRDAKLAQNCSSHEFQTPWSLYVF